MQNECMGKCKNNTIADRWSNVSSQFAAELGCGAGSRWRPNQTSYKLLLQPAARIYRRPGGNSLLPTPATRKFSHLLHSDKSHTGGKTLSPSVTFSRHLRKQIYNFFSYIKVFLLSSVYSGPGTPPSAAQLK